MAKSLGEPLVHRGEQVVGVLALVLVLPEASQAGGGAEFQGFGLLGAGYGEGLVEASLLMHVWMVRRHHRPPHTCLVNRTEFIDLFHLWRSVET